MSKCANRVQHADTKIRKRKDPHGDFPPLRSTLVLQNYTYMKLKVSATFQKQVSAAKHPTLPWSPVEPSGCRCSPTNLNSRWQHHSNFQQMQTHIFV